MSTPMVYQSKILTYIFIFLLPLILLFLLSYQTIVAAGAGQPTSDLASNMLLVNKIYQHGYLLFGNYSRFGFNHPGPFSFYLFFFGENIFTLFDFTRWQSWIITIVLRNAFMISVASILFSQYIRKSIRIFDVLLFQIIFIAVLNVDLFSTWPPHIVIATFLVFILSLSLYFRDNEFLWLTILTGLILISDYVTQGPIISPVILFVLLYNIWYKKRPLFERHFRRNIVSISLFVLIFLLPILFDVLINHPNNIQKILQVNKQFVFAPQPSYWETIRVFGTAFSAKIFQSYFLTNLYYFAGLLGVFSLGFIILEHKTKPAFLNLSYILLIIFMLLCTGIFINKHTLQPLYPYTIFCFTVIYPLLLSLLCSTACSDFQSSTWNKIKNALFLVLSLGMLIQPIYFFMYAKPSFNKDIAILAKYFLNHHSKSIIFGHPDVNDWPEMSGLLVYLIDHHVDVYTNRKDFYTPEREELNTPPNYLLLQKKYCAYMACDIVSQSDKRVIIKAPAIQPQSAEKITGDVIPIDVTTDIKEITLEPQVSEIELPLLISNRSQFKLLSPLFYKNGIFLSYDIYDNKMHLISNGLLNTPLVKNILPGASEKEFITIHRTLPPGVYYIKLSMVQAEVRGFQLQASPIKLIIK